MKTILDLSYVKARQYFLEPENYCSVTFPVYISFKGVLDYVEKSVGNKSFEDILKEKGKYPSKIEGVNHRILMKKDGIYAYRPIQIANPYLYYLLVKQLTTKEHWEKLTARFKCFRVPQIEVASYPKLKDCKDKSHRSAGVTSWWEHIEQRSLELALHYRYMFVTDITNCYASMYTHTIAWAVMGKCDAKKVMRDKNRLGNIIDNYIQGMQFGQTNGLPQGSVLFDFIAEIILGYADKLFADKLSSEKIEDYKILRYRDDYRIFCSKKDSLERIAFILQEVLSDLNLQFNSTKTFLTEDIITKSIKEDKLWYITNLPLYKKCDNQILTLVSSFQQEALFIHQFAKKYPNSGTIIKMLTSFSKRLKVDLKACKNPLTLISIFVDIAMDSPKAYPMILMIISILLQKITTETSRKQIVSDIYEKFMRLPNIGELQIWLQRITYQIVPPINYTEKICKIVAKNPNLKLWNNDWVADTYKENFPTYSICTDWIRNNYTPVINMNEVSLFDNY